MPSFKSKNKIYLARPISGCSGEEVLNWYDENVSKLIKMGFDVASPMTGKGHMRTELEFKAEGYGTAVSSNHAIYQRDKWMVVNSDIVLCYLCSSKRVSIGAMHEIAWAAFNNKHVIVVMEKDNIHRHAFVLESASIVFETMDEALTYLKNFTH